MPTVARSWWTRPKASIRWRCGASSPWVGRPGIPEGSPIDVALAVNLGPLPLKPGTRYTWRMAIDGESQTDWVLGFTTRPTLVRD